MTLDGGDGSVRGGNGVGEVRDGEQLQENLLEQSPVDEFLVRMLKQRAVSASCQNKPHSGQRTEGGRLSWAIQRRRRSLRTGGMGMGGGGQSDKEGVRTGSGGQRRLRKGPGTKVLSLNGTKDAGMSTMGHADSREERGGGQRELERELRWAEDHEVVTLFRPEMTESRQAGEVSGKRRKEERWT